MNSLTQLNPSLHVRYFSKEEPPEVGALQRDKRIPKTTSQRFNQFKTARNAAIIMSIAALVFVCFNLPEKENVLAAAVTSILFSYAAKKSYENHIIAFIVQCRLQNPSKPKVKVSSSSIKAAANTKTTRLKAVSAKVSEIGLGILKEAPPLLFNMSHLYLSEVTNMRIFVIYGSAIFFLLNLCRAFNDNPTQYTLSKCLFDITGNLGHTIVNLDTSGYIPNKIEYRIATDCILYLTTTIGTCRTIYEGSRRIISVWNQESTSTPSKISNIISGTLLITLGAYNKSSIIRGSINALSDLNVRLGTDRLALKHRSYLSSNQKQCNAVIFDGMENGVDGASKISKPAFEFLYKHCNTIAYDIRSREVICNAMSDSVTRLPGSIDILLINGHANNKYMLLSNSIFTGSEIEMKCINDTLSPEGQLFLIGCNTATPTNDGTPTLTETVADFIRGREVTGYCAYYVPKFTTSGFANGRFWHDNHYPPNLHGWVNPLSTAVTIKK